MRATPLLLAATAACAAPSTLAGECDLRSITSVLKKIAELPKVSACASASGFSLSPPAGVPDASQLDKICGDVSCIESVHAIAALDVPSCTLALLNNINIREIITQIETSCKSPTIGGAQSSTVTQVTPTIVKAGGNRTSHVVSDNADKSCQ